MVLGYDPDPLFTPALREVTRGEAVPGCRAVALQSPSTGRPVTPNQNDRLHQALDMKFTYKFSNLLGTVYRLGDIIFSHDGNTVICPVGNKISVYDLRNNRAHTLPIEARYNYTTLALAPNGIILIAAEEDGEVHIINLNFRNVLYRKRFNRPIKSIKFSPDGKHFALTKENGEKDLYKPKAKNAADEGEDDIPLPEDEEKTTTKEPKEEDDPELPKVFYKRRFRVFMDTHMGKRKVSVTAAQYHKRINMLVVAFASGDFVMLDMKDKGAIVHSLNISNQTITSVAMNQSGDWMALGVSSLGQLVVWEWQSESFILKQQGHFNNMRVVLYSPDGQNLATGGEDGKVKLWSCQTSFCFVTFSEHTAAVTGLAFTQSGRAIITSSLDGTVRAFDLTRYRNFKTLTSTRPTQFSCVTVDCSGELVASGSQDSHDIYLWSLQTGRLLEVLAGHQGPVSSVQFSSQPGSTLMVSTGWDGTVKVWDAISNTTSKESIGLSSDGLCVCIRPDGKQIAVATMDGQITMFNPSTGQQEGNITGRNDLGAGRADADKITAKKNLQAKSFTSICYSSDGKCLLAGGQGKNVCIYSIDDELLIKKFEVTQNRSFDAMDDIINRRKMAENGINLSLIEERDNNNEKVAIKLPGTRQGDMSLRAFRPEVRVSCLTFSPTGRSWAASTTEGLLVYSLDNNWLFDPLDLDFSNTPSAIKQKLKEKDYSTVNVVVSNLTQLYVEGVLAYIAEAIESTRHIGLYSHWATALVTSHGNNLKTRSPQIMSVLNGLQKSIVLHHTNLSKV
ncbi:Periodic tryptophan protein 2 [Portunus trituberculatus]|uniref:Periodic tryptophan protein 2 n=1 Tax=Portunus trituberculatus TaxID=210409 RepID=A0A5B7CZZ6_PORTR|nr:Periodic tryptophan protein 2 [Portunus trituberculatus]